MSSPITHNSGQQENRRATTFGMRLKQEREQRGITLDQISQSTKIGTRFLQALEEDHFEQLPGGIFNKGFVRAYARCVGMDEEQAVADYLTATGENQPKTEAADERPPIEVPAEPERAAGLPWGVLATLLFVLAFGLALWSFYSRVAGPRKEPPVSSAQTNTTQNPPAAQPAQAASELKSSVRPSRLASSAAPKIASSGTPGSKPPNAAAPSETAGPRELVLRINAHEDSWVSISVDGEVTTQETLAALSEKTVRARSNIIIKAGNIGALDFEFGGKPLPSQGKPGEVKTLSFDASGWHVVPKPASAAAPQAQP